MIQLCFEFYCEPGLPVNDNGLTKKPELTLDTPDEIITRFYGIRFLSGWLKVKNSRRSFCF